MRLFHNGRIIWVSWTMVTVPCSLNMRSYPQDNHECLLILSGAAGVQWLSLDAMLSRYYIRNSEFEVPNVSVSIGQSKDNICVKISWFFKFFTHDHDHVQFALCVYFGMLIDQNLYGANLMMVKKPCSVFCLHKDLVSASNLFLGYHYFYIRSAYTCLPSICGAIKCKCLSLHGNKPKTISISCSLFF